MSWDQIYSGVTAWIALAAIAITLVGFIFKMVTGSLSIRAIREKGQWWWWR
jgi:hypothetical protein